MARTFAAALAALIAGCAPMQWVKPQTPPEQASRDEEECRQAAWRETSARSWLYQPLGPVFIPHPAGGGSFAWPSGAVVDPYGHQILEENRLVQFCMESRGYRLAPAPKQ